MSEHRPVSGRFRSLFWPITLIVLGVVFLLNNLGLLGQDLGGVIVSLWPVILVVVGLDNFIRWRNLTGPLVLIGLGVVFLLSNLGRLAGSPWETLASLWPLLIIAMGLELLTRGRPKWAAWGAFLLLLAAFGMLLLATGAVILG